MTDTPMTPEREQKIRRARTHCEAGRFETEDERPLHVWGPSQYPSQEMCQRCTVMRWWAEEPDTNEAVLLAEVDRLRARVAELEGATSTARAMHRKHADSEHCQYDDMAWPCPTVTALSDADEAADLAEGQAQLDAMRADHPAPCRVPDSPDCTCQGAGEQPVVAYRVYGHGDPRCLRCVPAPHGDIWTPVTSEDLPDGGICGRCGRDVLIPAPTDKAAR